MEASPLVSWSGMVLGSALIAVVFRAMVLRSEPGSVFGQPSMRRWWWVGPVTMAIVATVILIVRLL